ncbi:hypothetical protein E1091_01975 [Micromonospora fluostatini]|uniref:Tyr recombinase domain-containing protein n=1 Tax=Micromonospora fluostatini TaxID=1629071 RepID=A0ABY2DLX8_9ACTN|nr:hypothetical protein E1091_01975 [Micromonospora fluostatini]
MSRSRMATPLDMIAAHLAWMRAGNYADTTICDADKTLHRLHRALPEGLHGSTGDEIAAWLAAGRWSRNTVATYYKHVVRFYRWAARPVDPWLSMDPSAGLRRPDARRGLPRPADHDTAEYAIFNLPEPWRLVSRLTALAGLRPCEVATVRREDITAQAITVVGKGGKSRAIPTHPLIWETVWSRPPGPLLARRTGQPVDAAYVSRNGAYHLRRHGLPITLYRLRHFFGTTVQERYRDLRVTQELMGHASSMTTEGYTQVTAARLREAIAAMPFIPDAGTAAEVPPPAPPAAPAPPNPVSGPDPA